MYNWVSKNEPSKKQIEVMLQEIGIELSDNWAVKYDGFEQLHGKAKIYTFLLDDEKCMIAVERRDIVEFPK